MHAASLDPHARPGAGPGAAGALTAASTGPGPARKPRTEAEAVEQFEKVLVRQFVETMTDGLFKTNLAGDDAPGWMGSYQDTQRDMLTDILASHLVEHGALRLSGLLRRQMGVDAGGDAAPEKPAALLRPEAEKTSLPDHP